MKHAGILAVFAVALLVGAGCGGGSDSGGANGANNANISNGGPVQGVWSGTFTPASSRAQGSSTILMDVSQSGANISGTAQLISPPLFYSGRFTGSMAGTTAYATADFGAYGTVTYTLKMNGAAMTGSYVRTIPAALGGGTESGSASLTEQAGLVTPSIAGNYGGTTQDNTAGSILLGLSVTITQNGDSVNFSGRYGGPNNVVTGSGVVVGDSITFQLNMQGSSNVIDFTGTIAGKNISGTTFKPAANSSQNGAGVLGTFTLAPVTQ